MYVQYSYRALTQWGVPPGDRGLNCAHISHCVSCVCTTTPYLSSAKACTITMESVTSPHVLRFTGFDPHTKYVCLFVSALSNKFSISVLLNFWQNFATTTVPATTTVRIQYAIHKDMYHMAYSPTQRVSIRLPRLSSW